MPRCHGDGSVEMRESNLSEPGTGFEPRRFVDDGIGDAKLMADNRDMAATDYQKFDIDGERLARDVDSVESNVNVNVNSLAASGLPWNTASFTLRIAVFDICSRNMTRAAARERRFVGAAGLISFD